MHHLILTDSVQADIQKILIYSIDTFGEHQANKYYDELLTTIDKIGSMPTIGHNRKDLPISFRAYTYSQHSIIYTVDENAKAVTIARILHSSMDFTQKL